MDNKQAILGFTEFFKGITGNQDLEIPSEIAEKIGLQAQTDGDIITALCSLPKIISEDGQDYVQLADVLETVRRFKPQTDGDLISRQALLNAFGFSEKTRKWGGDHSGYNTMMLYEIQDVIESQPPVKPQEPKTGHWIKYGKLYQCSECKELSCCQGKFCNECGCPMEIDIDGMASDKLTTEDGEPDGVGQFFCP